LCLGVFVVYKRSFGVSTSYSMRVYIHSNLWVWLHVWLHEMACLITYYRCFASGGRAQSQDNIFLCSGLATHYRADANLRQPNENALAQAGAD
jgi:hypothetical protein